MSTLAKLSKQAAQLEHDRQYQKALASYARLFDEAAGAEEEVDVALYNRAGDLAMRLGDAPRAVGYYERAIDGYAAGGLLNNAIAVCNKVLRHSPEHAATHYTLAVLHAKQGFRGDAKHHYVEYADRMHRAGREDEARRAIAEFAALCPPDADARALLARHLARGNRGTETSAHLEAMLDSALPAASAPASDVGPVLAAPAAAPSPDAERARDLVFLDVSLDAADPADAGDAQPPSAVEGLEFTAVGEPAAEPLADLAIDLPTADESLALEGLDAVDTLAGVDGLEGPADTEWGDVAPLDLDGFASAPAFDSTFDTLDTLDTLDALDSADADAPGAPVAAVAEADALDLTFELPADDLAGDDLSADDPAADDTLDFLPTDEEPLDIEVDAPRAPRWGADLPGELPPLSLAGWIGSAEPTVIADAPAADRDEPREPLGPPPAFAPEPAHAAADAEFVDLGAWLRDSEPAPSTRMTIDDAKPTGDESADFARLLGAFKAGIARNVDADDHAIHYDLGVAFREMGLLDEAIAEFQRAARGPDGAVRAGEAIGQCFLDRGSPELALTTLRQTLDSAADVARGPGEPSLLGVVYLLGEAHARLGQADSARACFERVVAADIEFRDAARRLSQLSAMTP